MPSVLGELDYTPAGVHDHPIAVCHNRHAHVSRAFGHLHLACALRHVSIRLGHVIPFDAYDNLQ